MTGSDRQGRNEGSNPFASTMKVRIKKGVRPYGGRILEMTGRATYPNGREVINVRRPNTRHTSIMEYSPEEVEIL